MRQSIIDKYGKRTEDGKFVPDANGLIDWGENKEIASKAINELVAEEVEVSVYEIKTETIGNAPLNANLMKSLFDFVLID